MSIQKKNVIAEFLQEDYVPSHNQIIVKYLSGKGNNLHEVQDPSGAIFLVSMPKKFRQTVWLRKGNCLIVDPVIEGNKVKGEIMCLLPNESVVDMVKKHEWSHRLVTKDELIQFFQVHEDSKRGDSSDMMPSSSEEDCDDDDDNDDDDDDVQHEQHQNNEIRKGNMEMSEVGESAKGLVTVTSADAPECLEFDAESSEESLNDDLERRANTIRIQVSYSGLNNGNPIKSQGQP